MNQIDEEPKTTNIHGKSLVDEFQWMKTDKKKATELINEVNKETNDYLKKNKKLQETLVKEYKTRILEDYDTIPTKNVLYTYQYRIKKGENYGRYLINDGCKEIAIMDCEKLAKPHKYWDMSGPQFSKNEQILVFSVDYVGNDENKLFYKNYNDDTIYEIKNPNSLRITNDFVLANDSNTLYYTTMDITGRQNKVWVTFLDNKEKHTCVFTEKESVYNVGVSKTSNGDCILIYSGSNDYTEVVLVENTSNTRILYSRKQKSLITVDKRGSRWYILFEKNNKSRIVYSDDKYCKNTKSWINYKKGVSIEYFIIQGEYMVIGYKIEGLLKIKVMKLCDKKEYEVIFENDIFTLNVPGMENINKQLNQLVVHYDNYLVKGLKIKIDLESGEKIILKDYKIKGYNKDNYILERVKVDKKLMITMIRKKTTKLSEGPHNCLIEGYGAYGSTINPEFDIVVPSLLDRGFIYCIAHIRGGGYYDTQWYKDGKMLKKMNTFKDFISCIDYVLDKKYTSREKLRIFGRSAGGLLIGATVNMIPEKIGMAIMGVPFVDVINTMLDDKLNLTTGEYTEWGNPKKKKYFDYILKYSPYENINLNKKYPNMYIYGNLEDSRVSYWEPLKYYARIRKSDVFIKDEKKIHLNINTDFGHSQSSERYAELRETAIIQSVIINQ